MAQALVYGVLASSGFVVGVLVGLYLHPPRRVVAGVLAFGSGVLVSALTLDLMTEAFETGSPAYAITGFAVGALVYVAFDYGLDRLAERSPRREGRHERDVEPGAKRIPESTEAAAVSGTALLLGEVIDGIPENGAIGVSLGADNRSLGLILLAAVFLGNVPATMSSAVGMVQEGRSRRYILVAWALVCVACTGATVAGYAFLSGASPDLISAMLALAAGGILAMLADTMMPEAFENGGPFVALATSFGFLLAFLLSHATG